MEAARHYRLTISSRTARQITWVVFVFLTAISTLSHSPMISTVHADDQAFAIRHTFGNGVDWTDGVVTGDIDGDGILDLIVANRTQSMVYLNDGHGNFYNGAIECGVLERVRCFGTGSPDTYSVAVGDMDGDSDLDIVASGEQKVVFLNDGHGNFYFTTTSAVDCNLIAVVRCFSSDKDYTPSVVVGDLDGKNGYDIVVAKSQQNMIYLNDGSGNFTLQRPFGPNFDNTASITIGNMDGKNGLDIVVGNSNSTNVIYLNDGQGNFYIGTVSCGITDTAKVRCFGTGTDATNSVAVGDVDGNGHLDIVAGNYDGPGKYEQSVVYLNDGQANFYNGAVTCGTTDPAKVRCFGLAEATTVSVVLGDVDRNNNLDIVVGNSFSEQGVVYLNQGNGNFYFATGKDLDCSLEAILRCYGTGTDTISSMAVADLDGNDALDLVAGTVGQDAIYLNSGASLLLSNEPTVPPGTIASSNILLGDLDDKTGLDIVSGNVSQNLIYLNNGNGVFGSGQAFGRITHPSLNMSVGDMDGQNGLDIIVGYSDQASVIYLNNGSGTFYSTNSPIVDCGLSSVIRCFGSPRAWPAAVGDIDGQHGLDIIVTSDNNTGQKNIIYFNDGQGNFDRGIRFGAKPVFHLSPVAVGDIDGDNDLDIVVGKYSGLGVVYLNNGSGNFYSTESTEVDCNYTTAVRCFGTGIDQTDNIAVADLDGRDGLDIVVGNIGQNKIYLNDGAGHFHRGTVVCGITSSVHCFGTGNNQTRRGHMKLGDVDGNGTIDIILDESNAVYLNDGAAGFHNGRITCNISPGIRCFRTKDLSSGHGNIEVGDLDGNGTLDIVEGYVGQNLFYFNQKYTDGLPDAPPYITVSRPGSGNSNFFSTPTIFDKQTIPITFTVFDRESDSVGFVRADYSPDGGGSWFPAVAATGTITRNLDTAGRGPNCTSFGCTYTYTWDVFASNFFGQSDNVVFRLEAYPGIRPRAKDIPGPYQRSYASSTTFPFRVRGTQVRVQRPAPPAQVPATLTRKLFLPIAVARVPGSLPVTTPSDVDVLVYRIRPGQVGTPLANAGGQPFHTGTGGYLQGRGEIQPGDQLVALQPIAATSAYTVYLTNATPITTGLDIYTIQSSGVQTLTVSTANPLILFNLSIALEWDARNDTKFLSDLTFDLQRTSELLYDWTNGQAALGDITVYHAKAHWDDANIRLNASNRLRPSANQGGIAEPLNQVRIGAVWNRFSDPSGNQGEDWPRALAHELGHYAFSLDDNYLGLDGAGKLISISGCPGAMSDPYRDDQSEFHPRADWLPNCRDTLANRTSGQSDWETILRTYPWLHAPSVPFKDVNSGPSRLPLAVTQIHFVAPVEQAAPVATSVFNLTRTKAEGGGRLLPGDRARAFLFKRSAGTVTDLIDLGRPVLDQVTVRGAEVGDRLCVYDLEATRLGCKDLVAGDTQLALGTRADWQPQLKVTPVTSRTLTLEVQTAGVGNLTPLVLQALVFPSDVRSAPSSATLTLQNGVYQGSITLTATSLEGYVQIEVPDDGPFGRAIVTDYALGGNPAPPRRPRRRTRRRAPAMSTDGQVIMYGKDLDFANGEFYAIQTATALPPPPSWATFVGQGYHLIASPNAPALTGVALNVSYADGDVATGTANGVSLYRRNGPAWQRLPGLERGVAGEVTAPISQDGLYVLMSSAEIELATGINLVAYPIAGERPVGEALASIAGAYTTVRSYDPATGRWLIYTAGAPEYANTLKVLEYGKGYEIRVTRDLTLLLRGEDAPPAAALARILPPVAFPPAPASYYGVVNGGAGFVPATGQTVRALIDGQVCGQGQTQLIAGQVVYTLDVAAESAVAGCGAPGRLVTFEVAGRRTATSAIWRNDQAHEVDLAPIPFK